MQKYDNAKTFYRAVIARPEGRGNLPVQYFHTAVHLDELYREIAPKGIPFGPTSGAPLMPSSQ